jgi:hypothetical protein
MIFQTKNIEIIEEKALTFDKGLLILIKPYKFGLKHFEAQGLTTMFFRILVVFFFLSKLKIRLKAILRKEDESNVRR